MSKLVSRWYLSALLLAAAGTQASAQTLDKSFAVPTISINHTTSMTFTINSGGGVLNFALDDTVPAGLPVTAMTSNGCGGSLSNALPVQNPTHLIYTGGSTSGSCQVTFTVLGTFVGNKSNTVNMTFNGNPNPIIDGASIQVVAPSFTKSFTGPILFPGDDPTIPLNGTTTLTFNVNDTTPDNLTSFGWHDELPDGMQVIGGPPTACGGTVSITPTGNHDTIDVTGASLTAGLNCSAAFLLVATTATPPPIAGIPQQPAANQADGTGDLLTLRAQARIHIYQPEFTKTFLNHSIRVYESTTMTIHIANITGSALNAVGFTDPMPSNLEATSIVSSACSNATNLPVTLTPGIFPTPSSVSVTGGSIPNGVSCDVIVNVRGIVPPPPAPPLPDAGGTATRFNLATGTGDLDGLFANDSIDISWVAFSKSASPMTFNGGTNTTFTVTINNVTTVPFPNLTFSDILPAGLTLVAGSVVNGCPGGTVTPLANGFSIPAFALAPAAMCTVTFQATGPIVGVPTPFRNTATGAGDLLNFNPFADVLVTPPPAFTKTFGPGPILVDTPTTLTFNIGNQTAGPLANIGFTDTLPVGLDYVSTGTNTCTPTGTLVINPVQPVSVTFSGGTLPAPGSCQIVLNLKTTSAGLKDNTAMGTGSLININPNANVTVLAPDFIKSFSPSTILLSQTSTLTLTITNTTGLVLPNFGFTDSLAALGLTTPNVAGTPACGGTLSVAANVITLINGTLPIAGSCSIPIVVTPTTATLKNNVANGTGNLFGLNPTAPLNVQDTTFNKEFVPPSILSNQTSTLTFHITNPTPVPLTNFGFTDNLGSFGLSAPNASFPMCGGTFTVAANVATFVNGVLAANGGICNISVVVTPTSSGPKVNTANGTGDIINKTATATLNVAPPGPIEFSKAFGAPTVPVNTNVSLTFTITNKTGAPANALGFTDALPPGMTVVNPPAPNNTCNGNLQALSGATSITLTNGTLANTLSCSVTVTVKSSTPGVKDNIAVGKDDLNGKDAPATIVITQPVFSKVFSTNSTNVGAVVRLTFTIPNTTGAALNVGFNDPLPAGLVVANPQNISITGCGGAPVFNPAVAATLLTLTNGVVQPGVPCVIGVDLINTSPGAKHNDATGTGDILNQHAIADLTVFDAPVDAFQLRYFSNLNIGDSFINLSNSGASSTVGLPDQNGNLCVNAYTYSPDEQLISCCSCLVTPNGLNSLSVRADLASVALTPVIPSSVVVKLLATRQNGTCNAATPTAGDLRGGMLAWGATLHALPVTNGTPATTYGMPETRFARGQLSVAELNRMTSLCAFIQANGSGYGVCKSCKVGGLGAAVK